MKNQVDIDKITDGMILAQDILDKNGHLLIPNGTVLTKDIIEKVRNVSSKKSLLVEFKDKKIGVVVEKVNKRLVELNSGQIQIADVKKRLEVKKKMREMEQAIENTFASLNLNENDENAKTEIEKTVEDIKKNLDVNIELLEEITEIKEVDAYLYIHSLNVAILSHLIGKWLKLPEEDLEILVRAGLLHDIGKLKIDPNVLNKPGKLSAAEFEEMKKHSSHSYNMLKKSGYTNQEFLKAVIFHHEKQDGSGYPLGLKDDQIPIHARIIAVADIFDAMTSERVYKKRVSPFKVLEMFQNQNFGKLDLHITMVFVKRFSEYYLGASVILSNGEVGRIVSLNHYEINKPLVETKDGEFLDISKNRTLEIIDFVSCPKEGGEHNE